MKAYRALNKPNLNKMQNTVLDKVQCTSWNTGNTEEISGSTISNSCLYFSFPALPHLLAHLVQAWIGIESEVILAQLRCPRELHVYMGVETWQPTHDCWGLNDAFDNLFGTQTPTGIKMKLYGAFRSLGSLNTCFCPPLLWRGATAVRNLYSFPEPPSPRARWCFSTTPVWGSLLAVLSGHHLVCTSFVGLLHCQM